MPSRCKNLPARRVQVTFLTFCSTEFYFVFLVTENVQTRQIQVPNNQRLVIVHSLPTSQLTVAQMDTLKSQNYAVSCDLDRIRTGRLLHYDWKRRLHSEFYAMPPMSGRIEDVGRRFEFLKVILNICLQTDRRSISIHLDGSTQSQFLDSPKTIELTITSPGQSNNQLDPGMYFVENTGSGKYGEIRRQPLNEITEHK
jgi:hypothetical protein